MAECNVNINKLPEVGEVKSGDLIIIENADGTQAVDFKNFIVTEDNISFASTLLSNTNSTASNYALIQALSASLTDAVVGWDSLGINWTGNYDPTRTYQKGDAVYCPGPPAGSFIADCPVPAGWPCGAEPYWDPLVLSPEGGLPLSRKGELLTHDGAQPCGDIITLSAGAPGTVLASQGTNEELIWTEITNTNCKSLAKGLHTGNHHFADRIMLYHMSDNTIMSVGAADRYGTAYGESHYNSGQVYNRPQLAGIDMNYDPVSDPIKDVYQTGMETQFFITSSGNVWGVGFNADGQLGDGSDADAHIFERNEYFYDNNIAIKDIISNGNIRNDLAAKTVYFLTLGGDVYSCGYNGQGGCGLGNPLGQNNPVTTPSKITALADVTVDRIYTGGYYATTFAVTTAGDTYGWGYNNSGQLGNGSTTPQTAPTILTPTYLPTGVVDMKIFDMDWYSNTWNYSSTTIPVATFALISGGGMHFAGYTKDGISGTGTFATTTITTFSAVSADVIYDIVQFDVNPQYKPHVVAVDSLGNCFAWGDNTQGQLCLTDQDSSQSWVSQSSPVSLAGSLSSSHINSGGADIRNKVAKVLVGSPSLHSDTGLDHDDDHVHNTYFQDTDGNLYACGRNSRSSIPLQGTTWTRSGKLVKIPLPCKPSDIAEWKVLHLGDGGTNHWYSSELAIRTKDGRVFLAGSAAALAAWGDGGTSEHYTDNYQRDHWIKVAF